jgi:hypothetical protein
MTYKERLDLAVKAAQSAYAFILDVGDARDDSAAIGVRVMALMLAATWAGVEHGSVRPWRPGVRRGGPTMTRDQFLKCAADIFDTWAKGKPGAHLTVIEGRRR